MKLDEEDKVDLQQIKVEVGEEKKEEKKASQTLAGGIVKGLIGLGSPQKGPTKGLSKGLQVLSISNLFQVMLIGNNKLDKKGHEDLVKAIKQTSSIMKLYMANTGLSGNLKELFSIFNKESRSGSIIRLDISILEEIITIGNNKIGDDELKIALFHLMGIKEGDENKKKKQIEAGKDEFGNLTDLRIGMNQIQDTGCIWLSKVLEKQERMEAVDLCKSLC